MKSNLLAILGVAGAAALIVCVIWRYTVREVGSSADDKLGAVFSAALEGAQNALEVWAHHEIAQAEWWAKDPAVVAAALELSRLERDRERLLGSQVQAELRERLSPYLDGMGYRGFFLIAPDGVSLASTRDVNVGTPNLVAQTFPSLFSRVLHGGERVVSPRQTSDVPLDGTAPETPTMFAIAPVRDEAGAVVAVLSLRIDVLETLNKILRREGGPAEGELFVFDHSGRVLVETDLDSEPDPHLQGLSVDRVREVMGYDPHVVPGKIVCELQAYAGRDGDRVVGARVWDAALGMGVGVEAPYEEAYSFVRRIERSVAGLGATALLLVAVCATLVGLRSRQLEQQLVAERASNERLELARQQAATAAEEARRHRDQATALFKEAGEGILGTDARGIVTEINPAASRMFGYTAREATGMDVETLLPGCRAWRNVVCRDAEGRLEQQTFPVPERGLSARHKDGEQFSVEVIVTEVGSDSSEGTRFVGFIRDVTDRVRVQEALFAAHAQLEERVRSRTIELERSNRELEQFAYVASHDLQEPLRMVASYLQLVEERYADRLDADAKDFIGFAVDGAQRMKILINDLLTLSRVGTYGEPMESVELEEALDEARGNLELAFEESGVELCCEALPAVKADRVQLVQLLQNLLENAIKYRSEAPLRIDVGATREPEGAWRVSVADNGVGLDPKHAERVFAMFQRLHVTGEYPGTGIGLAVCKKIVERHGGRVWVESRPGEGATFFFTMASA